MWVGVGAGLSVGLTAVLVSSLTRGPGGRIGVSPPRPGFDVGAGVYANPPWHGFDHWPQVAEIAIFAQALAMYGWYAWTSIRQGRFRPPLIMLIVGTLIAPLWDPLISWAAYTAYDPRLWHLPDTWPLYDIVPTVQPIATLPGYAMFFVASAIPGLLLHNYFVRTGGPAGLCARRPLLTLFVTAGTCAAIFDAIQAYLATRLEVITYSQIATAAFRPGTTWQSNAFWEPLLSFVMFGVTALTLYEDSDGYTIAHRWRHLNQRPLVREFAVSFLIITAATAFYTGAFTVVRISGAEKSVACPWPYQNTVVYDPNGLYAKTCPARHAVTSGARTP
jgi:hypothetical protein